MFVEQALKQYIGERPSVMLDLCAAPGGKSTHARSVLPVGSLLVANEVIRNRSQILAENLTKWGHPGVVVTNNDPADFAGLEDFFDVILTDVPCSGEGMFRKDPVAVSEWSPENVEICWQRQRRIISDIWPSLKPGGLLIYSTCTYNTKEDEENIRSFLVLNLKRSGYEVIEAETGEIALEKYHENQDIAVAVLDVMLPGIDGYEVCRAMRGAGYQAGVIMLTARTQEADKVTGLMNGADDYVTKPFSVIELAARVDALYRRVSGSPFSEDDVIKSGPFKLNLRAREVLKNGVKIELTQIEYGLLKAFMQNIGKALSRDELLEMVWGHHYVGELKIVDVNIRRLRIKIEDSPADPTHIVTVRGYGYMWEG